MSLQQQLHKYFGYAEFRDQQEKIIQDILDGNDVLTLMPTGGGKSICYQLPALIQGGLTVVISPLISLIHDQIDDLKRHGIPCHQWSTGSAITLATAFHSIEQGKCNLFYTTPEGFNKSTEMEMYLDRIYEAGLLKRFIIDEAHCVSNWGHEFRPDYLNLQIRARYPTVPICGFTATATRLVCYDIIEKLNMNEPLLWLTSFVKTNLQYEIRYKNSDSWAYISKAVVSTVQKPKYMGKTGIIYCLSRKMCEYLAGQLQDNGILADYYHAKMTPKRKTTVQDHWLNGKLKIIVATIAFALGINKPDVRYVIHTSMPKSIESYYQQTGRAGRDGNSADCIMFYSHKDHEVLSNMIDNGTDDNEAPVSTQQKLDIMLALCQNPGDCLKVRMSNYLGETGVVPCRLKLSGKMRDCVPCGNCSKTNLRPVTMQGETDQINATMIKHPNGIHMYKFISKCNLNQQRVVQELINQNLLVSEVQSSDGTYEEILKLGPGVKRLTSVVLLS